MTFATEVLKPDIDKYALVRIRPKRLAVNAVSIGGGQYTVALGAALAVDDVKVNGTSATFTQAGETLTITSGTNLTVLTNKTVIYYFVYYTATKTRYTLAANGLDAAEWMPQLASYPVATSSMRNLAEGVLSLSSSSLEVYTTDLSVQKMLAPNNSVSRSEVKVWLCAGSDANNRVIFEGYIASVTVEGGKAKFEVIDSFLKLLETATYESDALSYVTANSASTTYPDISTSREPAKLTAGYSSPFKLQELNAPVVFAPSSQLSYYVVGGQRLIKNTPRVIDSTSTAAFFVGRFLGTALRKLTFGTVTRCYKQVVDGSVLDDGTQLYAIYYYVQCSNFWGEIGDLLPNGLPGVDGSPIYICNNQVTTGPDSQNYTFICFRQMFILSATTSPASGLQSNPTMVDNSYDSYCVYRKGIKTPPLTAGGIFPNQIYYITEYLSARPDSHGTINGQTISSLYIDLSFGSGAPEIGFYIDLQDINSSELYCRFSPATQISHGDLMKFIVKSAGLEVNATSFTQADTDLDVDVSVTFPIEGGGPFKRYLDDAQILAKSTLGLLRVNADREVEYEIISTPGVADFTRDNTNVLDNSFTSKIEYQDVVTEVEFKNPQLEDVLNIYAAGPGYITASTDALYLHEVKRKLVYEHCLKDIANRRLAIAGYLASPTVEYTLATASQDLDVSIGDVIDVTNNNVLSETSEASAVVIEVSKGATGSNIKLNELRGVP